MISVGSVFKEFENFFQFDRNYNFYESSPLLSNDPTLLLTNSTISFFKNSMVLNNKINKVALAQLCFRTAQKVNSYPYSFTMLGVSADIEHLTPSYDDIVSFLMRCGIPKSKLHVILNKNDDLLIKATRTKFKSNQINYLDNNNNKYYVRWKFGNKELSGNGLTIAANLNENESDILNESFVPLGNIILVSNTNGQNYIDIGFGAECILSYFFNGDIFLTPFYNKQIEALKEIEWLHNNEKFTLKILHGLFVLFSEKILPGNKREEYIATKIQNQLFSLLCKLNKNTTDIDLLIKKIEQFYSSDERKLLIDYCLLLKINFEKYQKSINVNFVKAKKLVSSLFKKKIESINIKQIIQATFGLPSETIEVMMQNINKNDTNKITPVVIYNNLSTINSYNNQRFPLKFINIYRS